MRGKTAYELYQWAWAAVGLVFPPTCAGCGAVGAAWCAACQHNTTVIHEPFCSRCGLPLSPGRTCPDCSKQSPLFDAARSYAVFDGPFREAIHQLKYHGNAFLGEALAFPAKEMLEAQQWPLTLVVPVPLAENRMRTRGYNQAAFISLPIALFLNLPHRPDALRRVRETQSQVGLSIVDRHANMAGAFRADPRQVAGQNVLLIDDVMTTGATTNAAAEALKQAQAVGVYIFTLGRAAFKGLPDSLSNPTLL